MRVNQPPVLTDEALLTLVQRQTFRYFWEFGHPVSGLARDRDTAGDVVVTGGSGFGLLAILIGIERGFVRRQAGIERIEKMVSFLALAERFHGAWPHWLNGATGKAIALNPADDGGDLVETALLMQGLLTVRQFLAATAPREAALIDRINDLWLTVEWDWYTQGGRDVLYWHWSPRLEWQASLDIRGYHEGLIAYILAAASPTHAVAPMAYHRGWTRNGQFVNGRSFHGHRLPLGPDYGGPLFFTHYSFLGLDPRGLRDRYADYWEQNVNHTLINRAYCLANPKGYAGYSERCWGLTASDSPPGYAAHSPTDDLGVISPTAAISSLPYTPEYSLTALRFFYHDLGDRLWGEYGFHDAFCLSQNWFARSYLAIDQGPIIIMIENHRSALLWTLFMSAPELPPALARLGFARRSCRYT